jgi:hypothetical protein
MGVDAGSVLIEGEAYKLYVGTALNDGNRKPDLTSLDLPTTLGGGTIDHKTITDVDYDEFLEMGSQSVTWSKESDWDEAALNLQFGTSAVAYTYKVVFAGGLDNGYVGGKTITLLGKDYVFSAEDGDVENTSIVLYAAGQTETVAAGGTLDVEVGGTTYTVTVVGVDTNGDTATIDINGEAFDVADDSTNGDTYVTKGDLNLYIKSIRAFKFPAESGSVQVFVGSEKLTLDSGNSQIKRGNDQVDGASVSFTSTSASDDPSEMKIHEMQITYTPDEEQFIMAGGAFEDPVFGAFKIAFGGIYPELTSSAKDLVKIEKSSSTKVKLSFTNKAGDMCNMDVYNTSAWAYGTKPIAVTNPSGTGSVLANWTEAGNISEGEYFLVEQSYYSYILQYVSTDSTKNTITLKDMCSGSSFDASVTTGFFYLGGKKYTFAADTTNEVIRVNQTGTATPNGDQVTLYTANKAAIVPVSGEPGNFTVAEAPYSTAGILGATEVVLDVATTLTAGPEINTIDVVNDTAALAGSGGLVSKDDTDYEYGVSASGTYIARDTDGDTIHIYTPATPAPVFVAVGADPQFSAGEASASGTVAQAVQIQSSVSKMESEVSTTALDRDVILIGGPCANSLVATALGMSSESGTCYTDFVAEYPTEGVITVVDDVFTSGQKALVVAGLNRDATRALAVKVMQGTVDYSA